LGQDEKAIEMFQNSLRIRERLAQRSPDVVRWEVNVARSLFLLGSAGDRPYDRYRRALTILNQLHTAAKLPDEDNALLGEIENRLADINKNE